MRPLKALAESAAELRVPLSLVLKSDLGREVLRSTSKIAGDVLPRTCLERFDPLQAVRKVRALYEELSR